MPTMLHGLLNIILLVVFIGLVVGFVSSVWQLAAIRTRRRWMTRR